MEIEIRLPDGTWVPLPSCRAAEFMGPGGPRPAPTASQLYGAAGASLPTETIAGRRIDTAAKKLLRN